jgi:hypothetical protein
MSRQNKRTGGRKISFAKREHILCLVLAISPSPTQPQQQPKHTMNHPNDEFQPAKLAKPTPAKSRSRRKLPEESSPSHKDPTNFTEPRTAKPNKPRHNPDLDSSVNSETSQMASVVFTDYDEVFDEVSSFFL